MKYFWLINLWLILYGNNVLSQDVHYSQFYQSPLFLNPALTGNYEGSWRVMDSYRQQWTAISPPYVSNALGYDQQMMEKKDKLSAGFLMIYDRSGDIQFSMAKLLLSVAYHKKLSDKYQLSAGLQPLFSLRTFSTQNLSFPDQYNATSGSFDAGLPSADAGVNRQHSNVNLNTGIYFKKISGKIRPEGGFSLHHVVPVQESFFDYDVKAQKRINVQSACGIDIQSSYFIKPALQYLLQEKASSVAAGTNLGYYLPANQAGVKFIYMGGFARTGFQRNTDAAVACVGMRIKNWDLGLSYDINVSNLKTATNYRGAFEISIIYTQWKALLDQLTPNCDRM